MIELQGIHEMAHVLKGSNSFTCLTQFPLHQRNKVEGILYNIKSTTIGTSTKCQQQYSTYLWLTLTNLH